MYEITDEGRAHLAENRETVDNIFDRIARLVGHFLDEPMAEVHGAFRKVGKATYSRATRRRAGPGAARSGSPRCSTGPPRRSRR